VEEDAVLPLDVDGEEVVVSGIVDLVHVLPDTVEIIDYKTDRGRHAHEEYRKQLSVYHHVLEGYYPTRKVTTELFYTDDGERIEVTSMTKGELELLVKWLV
jgi:ATP-dependent helicase/nuclease subunit A